MTGPRSEVEVEIAPSSEPASAEGRLAQQIDDVLRRACTIARAMTGAEQAALKLCLDDDPERTRKYFSLSEKYSAYRDFRVNPKGLGLHGMDIPPGEVVRMTQEQVLEHPLFENFGQLHAEHPPLRGWLATSVCGADGRTYGLLQLSDKKGGVEFDPADESNIAELAALLGETLDALRMASAQARP
jgi:GAF domain-containing protein